MLLFFSLIGIFLSIIFWSYNSGKNPAKRYLAGFFFLISLYVLCQYILLYSKSVSLVVGLFVVSPVVFPILYLIGPMLFRYIRAILNDNPKLRKHDWFHALPMLLYFAASTPFTFAPFSEKVEAAHLLVHNVGIIQTYASTVLANLVPNMEVYLSRPVLLLAYTIWSLILLTNYLIKNKHKAVFSGHKFMIKWLLLLLGLVIVLSTSHIILIIHTFKLNFSEMAFGLNVIRILSALGLIGLMISPFLFPEILYGLPRVPRHKKLEAKETAHINTAAIHPNHNHLENNYLQHIGHQVEACMKKDQPFLQTQCNISQLAVQIDIPIHHLSFYFREVKKQPFHEYRNQWRLNHAKKLILDGKSDMLTLEAIATLSGFPNRNAFRTAFQKMEGISPNDFVLQQKNID